MSKTHWKKHFNPNYLGAYSLDPGEVRNLTIASVKTEEVTAPTGEKDICLVVHFADSKPMIFNKTNAKTAADICGSPYTEDWIGRTIAVKVQKVKAFGETVPALRVCNPIKRKAISGDDYKRMIGAIKSGKYSKEDAKSQFNLTAAQVAEIEAI